ncbi:M15 family metallopeptidase [Psychrobacillus sp. FSL K6-2365]|uniref:M15 family metallopeptidase n=1 Tax=Psychrobacillus TaxID=1221880 RepID=UPI0030F84E9B
MLVDRSVKRLGDVHPSLKEYTVELLTRCYNEGILVQISSGFRSNEEQAYIYGQGRPSYTWNNKKYGSSGSIVSKAKPGTSVHNYGLAIDYFLVSDDGNQSLWTVNDKWKRVGAIAKSMGFEWGGDWTSFRDYPHLQFTKGLSIAQLKAGKRPTFPRGKILHKLELLV